MKRCIPMAEIMYLNSRTIYHEISVIKTAKYYKILKMVLIQFNNHKFLKSIHKSLHDTGNRSPASDFWSPCWLGDMVGRYIFHRLDRMSRPKRSRAR